MSPPRNERATLSAALYLLSGSVIVSSVFLPWWDDLSGLGVETLWPLGVLGAAAFMVLIALSAFSGRLQAARLAILGSVSSGVVGISMIGFYFQVDNYGLAEPPFTQYVEDGFYVTVAGFGLTWAAFLAAALKSPPGSMDP